MPRPKGSKNKGVFCLKGKKLEGEQLEKLLKNNAILHKRYKNDPEFKAKFFIDEKCLNCGKIVRKYKNNANGFCSRKCRWGYIKKHNPLEWKARSLSANLISGDGRGHRGKVQVMKDLVEKAVGSKCKYCGRKLTLKNVSLDHKTAKAESTQTRVIADCFANLQLICRECNRVKGNLDDYEYDTLLNFLNMNKRLKGKVLKRLGAGMSFIYNAEAGD